MTYPPQGGGTPCPVSRYPSEDSGIDASAVFAALLAVSGSHGRYARRAKGQRNRANGLKGMDFA